MENNKTIEELLEEIIIRIGNMDGRESEIETIGIIGQVVGNLTLVCKLQQEEIQNLKQWANNTEYHIKYLLKDK